MAKLNASSTSFRLTDEARMLLEAIARRRGVSKASVLEWIIREKAEALGIDPDEIMSAEKE